MHLEILNPLPLRIVSPFEGAASFRAPPETINRSQVTPLGITDGLGAAQPQRRAVEWIVILGHVFERILQPPLLVVIRAESQVLNRKLFFQATRLQIGTIRLSRTARNGSDWGGRGS